jgi:hypothetical protein
MIFAIIKRDYITPRPIILFLAWFFPQPDRDRWIPQTRFQKIKGAATPQRLLPFIITDKGIEASTTSRVV